MEEHWRAGYDDAARALQHPEVLQPPDRQEGVRTFDFGIDEQGAEEIIVESGPRSPLDRSPLDKESRDESE